MNRNQQPNQPRDTPIEPRLVAVSRRKFLQRSAWLGAIVAIPGLACGTNDEEVFGGQSSETASSSAELPAELSQTTTTESEEATSETGPNPEENVERFPAGAELIVAFAYEPSDGGRVDNPYIAVWVEDSDGELVDTISLWYEQSGKGAKWLKDLRRWYSASNLAEETSMSGATRTAGDYAVSWDGTDLDGAPVIGGEYMVYIEAAREHGPYQITSTQITLGAQPFESSFSDQGELNSASAQLLL